MEPTNRSELWAFLKSEGVSGVLIALLMLTLLIIGTFVFPAKVNGGDCRRVVQKSVKRGTVLVPYNYGHRNLLVEVPDALAYSELAVRVGVPVGTYSPISYTPEPAGVGLNQPRLIQRVIETYSDELVEEVATEQEQVPCRDDSVPRSECATEPGTAMQPHPGLAVAHSCAKCHTGDAAKAQHRPAFWDDAGTFIATDAQKQKMLAAAKLGTMPPSAPLSDRDYLALADWLSPPEKQTAPADEVLAALKDIQERLTKLEAPKPEEESPE